MRIITALCRSCLALMLLGGVCAAWPKSGQAATLVEKGQPRAVIILPEKPSPLVESAARVLRDHIKEVSGAELPIRTEDRIKATHPGADVGPGR